MQAVSGEMGVISTGESENEGSVLMESKQEKVEEVEARENERWFREMGLEEVRQRYGSE